MRNLTQPKKFAEKLKKSNKSALNNLTKPKRWSDKFEKAKKKELWLIKKKKQKKKFSEEFNQVKKVLWEI